MTLAALAACLAFIVYSGSRLYATLGPSRMAVAADGRLILLSHGRLHAFGHDGMRQGSMDLEGIGAPGRPSDFDLHRDGRVVLTNPDAPELVRCAWPKGPCERLPVDIKSLPIQEVLPLNAAKLHVDDAGGRYFISDNSGHRILVTDLQGKLISATSPGVVRHPNQLALLAPDRLAVVDTDHRRVATFNLDAAGAASFSASMPTNARGVVRPGRLLPFDSVRLPGGEVAVVIAAIGMKDSDVVFFDAAGKAARRAELAADVDPFDIELWRGRIWIADASRYRFEAIGLDGKRAAPLEDAAFLAELERERNAVERWRELRRFGQVGVVVIPLLGALLLWKLGGLEPARVPAAPARGPPQPAPGVQWIEPRPVFRRRLFLTTRFAAWAILVAAVAWSARFMILYRDHVFSVSGLRVLLPLIGGFVLMAGVAFFVYRAVPRRFAGTRVGFGPEALHFSVPLGVALMGSKANGSQPWKAVHFDGARVLAGKHLFALKAFPFGDIFPPEVKAGLEARVPKANVHSQGRLTMMILRARPWLAVQVLAFVAAALWLTAMELARLL